MHILEEKIRAARAAGRHALIPFVTFGFPDEKRFWPALVELDESGADIIEIGVPFSDPVADGPVVEEASRRVLSDGVCLERIMEELKLRAGVFRAGIVLMGYLNPFLQYGLEKLAVEAREAGVHGFIIPDLPFEESGDIRRIFAAQGLALIALVGPNTPEERMRLYADVSEGYVYVVSAPAWRCRSPRPCSGPAPCSACRWRWASVWSSRNRCRGCRRTPCLMPWSSAVPC